MASAYFLKFNVRCNREVYLNRTFPFVVKFYKVSEDTVAVECNGCDYLDGSQECRQCINTAVKYATEHKITAGDTISFPPFQSHM